MVRIWPSIVVAIVLAGLGWVVLARHGSAVTSAPAPSARVGAAKPASSSPLADPLMEGRAPVLDAARAAAPANWVTAPPADEFQYSLESDSRGVEPCNSPAPADARKLQSPLGDGYLYIPERAIDELGRFELVVHFHGQEPVLRELVASKQPLVVYTFTLSPGESYATHFSGPSLFPKLIERIEAAISERAGRETHARHVALTAWSAGFEGVRAVLSQPEEPRLDAIALIDGLHAPREPSALRARLAPFASFGERAGRGERLMIVTHSSIRTPEYASTTEMAHQLVAALGGRPLAVRRDDGFGLELVETFTRGELYVRGYAGNDKADHCAQLFLMRTAFNALAKRWRR